MSFEIVIFLERYLALWFDASYLMSLIYQLIDLTVLKLMLNSKMSF